MKCQYCGNRITKSNSDEGLLLFGTYVRLQLNNKGGYTMFVKCDNRYCKRETQITPTTLKATREHVIKSSGQAPKNRI